MSIKVSCCFFTSCWLLYKSFSILLSPVIIHSFHACTGHFSMSYVVYTGVTGWAADNQRVSNSARLLQSICVTHMTWRFRHIFKKNLMLLLQSSGRTDKNVYRIKENMDSMNIKSKPRAGKCCKLCVLLLHMIQGDFTATWYRLTIQFFTNTNA